MRKMLILILWIITGIYGLYFISSLCTWIYLNWDGSKRVYGQIYYVDSLNMQSFRQKYENLCLNDTIEKFYTSPYYSEPQKVQFVSHGSGGIMKCTYYSKTSNILMRFDVLNLKPLNVFFYLADTCRKTKPAPSIYPYVTMGINDGRDWLQNNKYLIVFEKEILSKICVYRRDQLQGKMCWYANFFERNFIKVVFIGIALIIIIVFWPIRRLRKITEGDRFEVNPKERSRGQILGYDDCYDSGICPHG